MMKNRNEGETAIPRLRSDAQRNRKRLLSAARTAFVRDGANASLDDIARAAGVGSGTLYRHFPTRESLIEAVFQVEVQDLADAAQQLSGAGPPLEALRQWLYEFIQYVANKTLILPAMDTVPGGSMRLVEGSRGQVHGSFFMLVQRAVEAGELKPGTDPQDLLRAMIGVFHTTFIPEWEASARRIVDLLIAGARADQNLEIKNRPAPPIRGNRRTSPGSSRTPRSSQPSGEV